MGFKVLALGWIGVQGFGPGVDWGSRFGPGVDWGSRFWGFVIGVQGFGVFTGSLGKVKKSENNQVKIPFKKKRISKSQLVDFSADQL